MILLNRRGGKMMKRVFIASLALFVVVGCGGVSEESAEQVASEQPALVQVEAPEPIPVPEPIFLC